MTFSMDISYFNQLTINEIKHSDRPTVEVLDENQIKGIYVKLHGEEYFLTCYHNINNCYKNKIYRSIREFDLAILKIDGKNTSKFVGIEDISNIDKDQPITIVSDDNITVEIEDIICDHIATTYIPEIPQIKMKCSAIYAGNLILQNNNPSGIVCYSDEDYVYGIPLKIIIKLFENDKLFDGSENAKLLGYEIPCDTGIIKTDEGIINCYFVNRQTTFNKDDIIVKVDNQYFDETHQLKYLEFNVNLSSYLLLKSCCDYENINISYYKQSSETMTNYSLNNPIILSRYNRINIYEKEIIKFLGITIAELSEEYLSMLLIDDIKLEEQYYSHPIDDQMDKKILFIRNVDYTNVVNIKFSKQLFVLNAPFVNGENGSKKLLILKEINGKIINNIRELKEFNIKTIKTIILSYIDDDEDIIIIL